jgi:hypothetical protein
LYIPLRMWVITFGLLMTSPGEALGIRVKHAFGDYM